MSEGFISRGCLRLVDEDEPGFWESLGYNNHGDPLPLLRYGAHPRGACQGTLLAGYDARLTSLDRPVIGGRGDESDIHCLHVYIAQLHCKIEADSCQPHLVVSIPGVG